MSCGVMEADTPTIPRHKTALRRTDLSRPAKCALRDGYVISVIVDTGHGNEPRVRSARC